jgi:putative tryptophan/tyrosine transport system substrate-binding protein
MRRRDFLWVLGGGVAAATPLLVRAQQAMPTVGAVGEWTTELGTPYALLFASYMKELGWVEGHNYRGLWVYTERRTDRYPELLGELIAQRANVIIVFGNPAIEAAQRATTTIPIVGMADDIVKSGHAASMARPGSNATGVSIFASELDVKRLELLHDAVPSAKRVGVLADPAAITPRAQLDEAARRLNLELIVVNALNREEVVQGLDALGSAHIDAVNVLASPLLAGLTGLISERLNQLRLPAIYEWPEAAQAGGLLAYGSRLKLCFRHVAGLVGKILHGARPENLPVG